MSQSIESDLPPNLSCLKDIDTLLRCPICFDYLNISMMTQCSHNFCSLCIRKFLSYKLLCPVCNTPLTEQELRNNRLLDDLVQSFQAARQQLCQTNFESPPISPKTPTMAVGGKAARQKALKKEGATLTHFFQKRAPVSSSTGTQSGSKDLLPVKPEPMEVCVQEAFLPESAVTVTTAVKEKKWSVHAFPSTSQDIKPVPKVECPVCSVEVSQQHINKHLDTCLTRGEKKDSLRRSDQLGMSCSACVEPNSQKRRPMAKLVYALMTMVELKRRLRECHLSTQGSREQLTRRHQEFIHIYNAQCDALNPRSSEDIAREVENNEKMRTVLESKSKPAIIITKKHTADEIEQLHSDYTSEPLNLLTCLQMEEVGENLNPLWFSRMCVLCNKCCLCSLLRRLNSAAVSRECSLLVKGKQHNGEFSRLIAQVRGRLENSRRTKLKQEEEKSVETSCCSADDTVVQNTPLSPVSSTLDLPAITSNETTPVIDVGSRSQSPTLSEVSVSSSICDVFN